MCVCVWCGEGRQMLFPDRGHDGFRDAPCLGKPGHKPPKQAPLRDEVLHYLSNEVRTGIAPLIACAPGRHVEEPVC